MRQKFLYDRPFLYYMLFWLVFATGYFIILVISNIINPVNETSLSALIIEAVGRSAVLELVGVGFSYFILTMIYEFKNKKINDFVLHLYAIIFGLFAVAVTFYGLGILERMQDSAFWKDEFYLIMLVIGFVIIFFPAYLIGVLLVKYMAISNKGFRLITYDAEESEK